LIALKIPICVSLLDSFFDIDGDAIVFEYNNLTIGIREKATVTLSGASLLIHIKTSDCVKDNKICIHKIHIPVEPNCLHDFDGCASLADISKFVCTSASKQNGTEPEPEPELCAEMWSQRGIDFSGNSGGNDRVGASVSLNTVGNIVAIGANQNGVGDGYVQIFEWDGTAWVQRTPDLLGSSSSKFGASISLDGSGDIIAIGSPHDSAGASNAGKVTAFSWNGFFWIPHGASITHAVSNDEFGKSVSLNEAGDVLAVGFGSEAKINVYDLVAGVWVQRGATQVLSLGESSNVSVSLNEDGTVLAGGAPGQNSNAGLARVFDWDGTIWNPRTDIDGISVERLGSSVSLDSTGNTIAVGVIGADVARIFDWDGTAWTIRGSEIPGQASGDQFGESISLSDDSNTVIVGVGTNNPSQVGYARVYVWDNTTWNLVLQINGDLMGDFMGISVSVNGDGTIISTGASAGRTGRSGYGEVWSFCDF
jgi:hypothetical protein